MYVHIFLFSNLFWQLFTSIVEYYKTTNKNTHGHLLFFSLPFVGHLCKTDYKYYFKETNHVYRLISYSFYNSWLTVLSEQHYFNP